MIRAPLITIAAVFLLGAAKPPTVEYRLSLAPTLLSVDLRLQGDAAGETRLSVPEGATNLQVRGARLRREAGTAILTHRAGAKLRIRYALPASPRGLNLTGAETFAAPEGRLSEPVSLRWDRLPAGWRAVTSLDAVAGPSSATVADLALAEGLAGPSVVVVERPDQVRVAARGVAESKLAQTADIVGRLVAAERVFWGEAPRPTLVIVPPTLEIIGVARSRTRIPARLGAGSAPPWLTEGLAVLVVMRLEQRAGLASPAEALARLNAADRSADPGARGLILALKWDEDVRRTSGGKLNLNDVIRRMADHAAQFPPGRAPDPATGLISAAWVAASLDLRPDIARYATSRSVIPLPEMLFDRCVDVKPIITPAFDAGFDAAASQATKTIKGVRRGGPAWNSGLRNGMALEALSLTAGDITREVTARVGDGRRKPRTVRFWPYGDAVIETRRLQRASSLSGDAMAACDRKIAGL